VEGKDGFQVQRKQIISKAKEKEEPETKENTLNQDRKCKQKDQASSKKLEMEVFNLRKTTRLVRACRNLKRGLCDRVFLPESCLSWSNFFFLSL
jgi:hypothetical protein